MHRARFLDQLVQALPPNRAHLNKRIINIEDSERNGVILHFQDGTSATTDAVVGADGIRSFLREHLLGKGMAQPFFTGSIAYRNIASMEQAIEKMGSDWMGKATILCGPSTLPSTIGFKSQINTPLLIREQKAESSATASKAAR